MRCKRMYVNASLPLAGRLIKQTTIAADWSVRSQRIYDLNVAQDAFSHCNFIEDTLVLILI